MRTPATALAFGALVLGMALLANAAFAFWLSRRIRWFRTARGRRVLTLGVVAVVGLVPIARALRQGLDLPSLSWVEAVISLWDLSLLLALPVLGALELWLHFRAPAPESELASAPEPAPAPAIGPKADSAAAGGATRREALATLAGSATVAAAIVPHAWGVARTRFDVDVVELPIRLPRLPRVLDGFTIVQVSDVHVGVFLGEEHLRRLEGVVRGLRPDLIAMTGDLVQRRVRDLAIGCDWLARLGQDARHGSVAILGNHEYYAGRAASLEAYRRAKVPLLVNETIPIARADGGGFLLSGVDDAYGAAHGFAPRFDLVEPSDERARVLLCHQPVLYPEAVAHGFDLVLAGHTHGGQIAPLGPIVTRATIGPTAGLYRFGATSLYVNRGLGTSGPPARVAVRPEITKIVLLAG